MDKAMKKAGLKMTPAMMKKMDPKSTVRESEMKKMMKKAPMPSKTMKKKPFPSSDGKMYA